MIKFGKKKIKKYIEIILIFFDGKINLVKKYLYLILKIRLKIGNITQILKRALGSWSNKFEILWRFVSFWLLKLIKKSEEFQLKKCWPYEISSKKK